MVDGAVNALPSIALALPREAVSGSSASDGTSRLGRCTALAGEYLTLAYEPRWIAELQRRVTLRLSLEDPFPTTQTRSVPEFARAILEATAAYAEPPLADRIRRAARSI